VPLLAFAKNDHGKLVYELPQAAKTARRNSCEQWEPALVVDRKK